MKLRNGMKAFVLHFIDGSVMVTLDPAIAAEHKATGKRVTETRLLADG